MKISSDAEAAQAKGPEPSAAVGPEPLAAHPREREASPVPTSVEALTAELRESQAQVRRLRAFLSHGLRQPMAALTIWAELLNAKQAAALDEQGRRYLRELTSSVHRIAAMLSSEVQATAEPHPSDEPPPSTLPVKRDGD